MSRHLVILPTGDEIRDGIVRDTDSPEIMKTWISACPDAVVTRQEPLRDEPEIIAAAVRRASESADFVVLVGGSGGGHRHEKSLGKDFTQSSLDELLKDDHVSSIYGRNGHLWCRMHCGYCGNAMIINVPGPFVEAKAAFEAFCEALEKEKSPAEINAAMTEAVRSTYG